MRALHGSRSAVAFPAKEERRAAFHYDQGLHMRHPTTAVPHIALHGSAALAASSSASSCSAGAAVTAGIPFSSSTLTFGSRSVRELRRSSSAACAVPTASATTATADASAAAPWLAPAMQEAAAEFDAANQLLTDFRDEKLLPALVSEVSLLREENARLVERQAVLEDTAAKAWGDYAVDGVKEASGSCTAGCEAIAEEVEEGKEAEAEEGSKGGAAEARKEEKESAVESTDTLQATLQATLDRMEIATLQSRVAALTRESEQQREELSQLSASSDRQSRQRREEHHQSRPLEAEAAAAAERNNATGYRREVPSRPVKAKTWADDAMALERAVAAHTLRQSRETMAREQIYAVYMLGWAKGRMQAEALGLARPQ